MAGEGLEEVGRKWADRSCKGQSGGRQSWAGGGLRLGAGVGLGKGEERGHGALRGGVVAERGKGDRYWGSVWEGGRERWDGKNEDRTSDLTESST